MKYHTCRKRFIVLIYTHILINYPQRVSKNTHIYFDCWKLTQKEQLIFRACEGYICMKLQLLRLFEVMQPLQAQESVLSVYSFSFGWNDSQNVNSESTKYTSLNDAINICRSNLK